MIESVRLFPNELLKLRFYLDYSESPNDPHIRLNYDQLFTISREDLLNTFRQTESFNLQGVVFGKSFNVEYNVKTGVSYCRLLLPTTTQGRKRPKLRELLALGWKQAKAPEKPMVTPKLKNKPPRR